MTDSTTRLFSIVFPMRIPHDIISIISSVVHVGWNPYQVWHLSLWYETYISGNNMTLRPISIDVTNQTSVQISYSDKYSYDLNILCY